VGVAAGMFARQCLEAGLLDEVVVDLVPIVMGKGRPYSGELPGDHPQLLADPTTPHLFPAKKGVTR
jgi:dihydrofolate reductase